MTDIAIVGIGIWGQNLVRTFDDLASVRAACHTGASANAEWLATEYPEIELTTDYDAVLADDRIDAIAVATPIPTLGDLAERGLEAGKHVYVEKPMAATREDAEHLVALAEDREVTLFVGYIFVHHPTFTWVRERLAEDGTDGIRLDWETEGSFGPGIVNNLACHPVSVAVAALGTPEEVSVTEAHAVTGETDVVSCRLAYGNTDCEVRVDRLSPNRRYRMTAFTDAGEAYVATDDEVDAFDRGSEAYETAFVPDAEPLGAECEKFLAAVESGDRPVTDGQFGCRVHDVLAEIKAGL